MAPKKNKRTVTVKSGKNKIFHFYIHHTVARLVFEGFAYEGSL